MSNVTVFQNCGAILPCKTFDKIEHEEIGTCAKIELSQDEDNADQKVKLFLKAHKTYKLLWEAYFKFLSSQIFIHVHILQIFRFPPPPRKSINQSMFICPRYPFR